MTSKHLILYIFQWGFPCWLRLLWADYNLEIILQSLGLEFLRCCCRNTKGYFLLCSKLMNCSNRQNKDRLQQRVSVTSLIIFSFYSYFLTWVILTLTYYYPWLTMAHYESCTILSFIDSLTVLGLLINDLILQYYKYGQSRALQAPGWLLVFHSTESQ